MTYPTITTNEGAGLFTVNSGIGTTVNSAGEVTLGFNNTGALNL